ncbi:SDR family NAD(P)-dependent oxidoreductase [Bacillus mangrovi]|uniref:SDR family NAD(P)-dependent oxidoreductase n=1 Tax=Metabacillus mangrovi TaxID=1491830 RepID=A0A7X2SB19_9BACI|nr:SDR family NAD(P)-dependent oxidoreductase [Metabacillus mangrovi]MTH55596.1 SDR family NAD(P)-dependent oxidoreductase [Metabacillus mangrovi]
MKKAAVLGASGGMGYHLVMELAANGIEVTAFARNSEKLKRMFGDLPGITAVSGDALHEKEVLKACSGADYIFHTVSVPYPDWEEGHPAIMRNALKAAKAESARLIIIDNIYAYGKSEGKKVKETKQKNPHTKKGKIRLALEETVKNSGTPYLFLHFPDYYGPNAENTLLHQTLKPAAEGKRPIFIGDMDMQREFIYTPDGAKAAVTLALKEDAYGQNWNIPGNGTISGNDIMVLLKEAGCAKPAMKIGKRMIWLMGLWDANMKEMREMMYLYENPVILSGEKVEEFAGNLPAVSYKEGIVHTLNGLKQQQRS